MNLRPTDPSGMAAHVAGAPGQIETALARVAASPLPRRTASSVVVGAMGGSAIAADLTASLFADRLRGPLVVVRDYRWPAWTDASSLAVLASHSGETEETLSLYRDAADRGLPRIAITRGGTLAAWCERDGVPVLPVAEGMPPRAALYSAWVAMTAVLASLGWIDDPAAEWRTAAITLRERIAAWRWGAARETNEALRIAERLTGRFPFVYGAETLAPMLTRWRNQLNENAKLLGHSATVPEMNHNEVVGWEGAQESGASGVVFVRDGEESGRVHTRLSLTAAFLERRSVVIEHAPVPAGGRLTRWATLASFGDHLSLHLAMLSGIDPTPIASLDEFKQQLSQAGSAPEAEDRLRAHPNP